MRPQGDCIVIRGKPSCYYLVDSDGKLYKDTGTVCYINSFPKSDCTVLVK